MEHRIHFRRAWDSPLGRIDLPRDWGDGPVPDRLCRLFRRPPIDASTERLWLVLERVPGLLSVTCNDRDFLAVGDGQLWEIPLDEARASGNLLVLPLDPSAIIGREDWGHIALAIRC